MSKNIIYCFSGSGGCLDMAKSIGKALGDTDIVMMRSFPKITDARGAERVGFIFPCCGGGLPGDVEEFVKAIKLNGGSYKFGIVQYSGYMGSGLYTIDRIVDLDYWSGISNHSSCIWLMPHYLTMPPTTREGAQRRVDEAAARIAEDLKNKKFMFKKPPKRSLNMIESKKFKKGVTEKVKKFEVSDSCVSCGTCAKICPKNNVRLVDGKPQFGDECIGCLSCVQYCPTASIDVGSITKKRERFHNANINAEDLMESVIHID